MRKLILLAGSAALVLATPAFAEKGGNRGHRGGGGEAAAAQPHGGGNRHEARAQAAQQQRAERQQQRSVQRQARSQPEIQRSRPQRGIEFRRAAPRVERQARMQQRVRPVRLERREARAERRAAPVRIERRERQAVRAERRPNAIRHAQRAERRRLAQHPQQVDRRQQRLERRALAFQSSQQQSARGGFRGERRRDNDLRRLAVTERRFGSERRGVRAGWTDHCPPGLIASGAQCIPPGQFRKQQAAQRAAASGWSRLYRQDDFGFVGALPLASALPLFDTFGYREDWPAYARYEQAPAYGYSPYGFVPAYGYAPAYRYASVPYRLYQPLPYGALDYGYGDNDGGLFGGDSGLLGTLIAVAIESLLGGSGGFGDLGLLSSLGGVGPLGGLGGLGVPIDRDSGLGGYDAFAPAIGPGYGTTFAAYEPYAGFDLGSGDHGYGGAGLDPLGLGGLGDFGLLSSLGGLGDFGALAGLGGLGGDSLVSELLLGGLLGELV